MFCKTTRNRIDVDPPYLVFLLDLLMFSHVIFLYALRPLDCPEVTALFSGMEDKTAAPLPSAVDDGEAGNVFSYEKADGNCRDL